MTKRSLKSGPPKHGAVGCASGSAMRCVSRPSGAKRASAPARTSAVHSPPSVSKQQPSGAEPCGPVSTKRRRSPIEPSGAIAYDQMAYAALSQTCSRPSIGLVRGPFATP